MRTSTFFTSALLLAAPACAQYTKGWTPGQPVVRSSKPSPSDSDSPSANVGDKASGWSPSQGGSRKLFDLNTDRSGPAQSPGREQPGGIVEKVLTSGPLAFLFNQAGVNISEKLEAAHEAQAKIWDMRIPLISDANYEEVIKNETFVSEEEERERVWFMIITAQSSGDSISKFSDQRFDELYNVTLDRGGLPHVRMARIDYLNVTYLTTKWNVWRAPYYVILKDRGQSLRFYHAGQLRVEPETLYKFLEQQAYLKTRDWSSTSSFAPGGRNEYILHYFARAMEWTYDRVIMIPRWLFVSITGVLGTLLIQLIHNADSKSASKKQAIEEAKKKGDVRRTVQKAEAKGNGTAAAVPIAEKEKAQPATPSKKRKGGKK